jgi:hypothetical protein
MGFKMSNVENTIYKLELVDDTCCKVCDVGNLDCYSAKDLRFNVPGYPAPWTSHDQQFVRLLIQIQPS